MNKIRLFDLNRKITFVLNTKERIKEAARTLFNDRGIGNITLRDISEKIGKSYGNITYHFPNKAELLFAIYNDMSDELIKLYPKYDIQQPKHYIDDITRISYDITRKYILFTLDHIEIKRNYPIIYNKIQINILSRQKQWKDMLKYMRDIGYLNSGLKDNDLEYIMFLSASVRFSYFQFTPKEKWGKEAYTDIVNKILLPYLAIN